MSDVFIKVFSLSFCFGFRQRMYLQVHPWFDKKCNDAVFTCICTLTILFQIFCCLAGRKLLQSGFRGPNVQTPAGEETPVQLISVLVIYFYYKHFLQLWFIMQICIVVFYLTIFLLMLHSSYELYLIKQYNGVEQQIFTFKVQIIENVYEKILH